MNRRSFFATLLALLSWPWWSAKPIPDFTIAGRPYRIIGEAITGLASASGRVVALKDHLVYLRGEAVKINQMEDGGMTITRGYENSPEYKEIMEE